MNMNIFQPRYPDRLDRHLMPNMEPGMGDINVMVKPSSLKDKTPMCLVNELARYNRIQHQYKLTKEEGPPHRKKFNVTLKLGDTEFEAQGSSIKKAQHEAAAIALRNTKYKHPPPKLLPNTRVNTTPTVELNALAMKRGEPTIYTVLNQPSTPYFQPSYPMNYYSSRNVYQNRNMYNEYCYNEFNVVNGYSFSGSQFNALRYKAPPLYKISLKIGEREYIADGHSMQAARHRAAKKALDELRNLPLDEKEVDVDGENGDNSMDDSKSPISAVHETAFKYNMSATFEVIDERGPPHMRTFVTECRVGDQFKSMGEGNGKKISKRRAAEKMLVLLQTLPPPPKPPSDELDKRRLRRKLPVKKRSLPPKDTPESPQEPDTNKSTEMNPVTRLMEFQKKKNGKEPVYVLIDEKGRGRKKLFTIEVKMDDYKCVGNGTSKKEAKRRASEEMLKLLGLDPGTPTSSIKTPDTIGAPDFSLASTPVTPAVNGKQLAPGLLLVPNVNLSSPKLKPKIDSPPNDYLKMTNGTSHFKEVPSPLFNGSRQNFEMDLSKNLAKEQLERLAATFGCEVKYSDFPKGHHHQEYLSLVTLSTNPPQTCYGSGDSTESAQNEAAFNTLSMISEMGIENLFSKKISYIPENEIVS